MDNTQIPKPYKSWLDFYNSIKNTKEFNSLGCYGEIKYQQYDDNFAVIGVTTISRHELDTLVLGEILPIIPSYGDAKEMLYEVSMCQSENTKQKSKLVDMIVSVMEIQSPNNQAP
jgi:hypothetical protein